MNKPIHSVSTVLLEIHRLTLDVVKVQGTAYPQAALQRVEALVSRTGTGLFIQEDFEYALKRKRSLVLEAQQ
jgi:hypothetical protein